MDNDTQKIIAQQMQILPPEMKQAILASDYQVKLQTITKNNKLMIDQAGHLETETSLVLLGLEPLDDYINNLQKNASMDKNTALAVGHDVDEMIFKNIRNTLQQISTAAKAAEAATPAQETPTKESLLSEIENPSVTRIPINVMKTAPVVAAAPVSHTDMEVRPEMLPEIAPKEAPKTYSLKPNIAAPYHENIPPVANIIESKMTAPVIVPKQTIVVEEKTKLPEKSVKASDPYRESII